MAWNVLIFLALPARDGASQRRSVRMPKGDLQHTGTTYARKVFPACSKSLLHFLYGYAADAFSLCLFYSCLLYLRQER